MLHYYLPDCFQRRPFAENKSAISQAHPASRSNSTDTFAVSDFDIKIDLVCTGPTTKIPLQAFFSFCAPEENVPPEERAKSAASVFHGLQSV